MSREVRELTLKNVYLGMDPYILIKVDAQGTEDDPQINFAYDFGGGIDTAQDMAALLEVAVDALRTEGYLNNDESEETK